MKLLKELNEAKLAAQNHVKIWKKVYNFVGQPAYVGTAEGWEFFTTKNKRDFDQIYNISSSYPEHDDWGGMHQGHNEEALEHGYANPAFTGLPKKGPIQPTTPKQVHDYLVGVFGDEDDDEEDDY